MSDNLSFTRLLAGLDVICSKWTSCALTTPGGESLYVKGHNFSDLGSMPFAGYTANKYFSLQDKQLVILNDPFSGGTVLSDITLVMGVSLTKNSSSDLLLINRIAFRPELDFSENLRVDSFRIPPTPLGGLPGFTKDDVINSMASAPLAPPNFKVAIESHIQEMELAAILIKDHFMSLFDGPLKKSTLESFFDFSQKIHHMSLDALPFDRAQGQLVLDDKSTLCLTIQNTQQGVQFDFAGTQLSPLYGLTNPSVLGICLGSLNSFLDVPVIVNHGHFKNIAVNTPSQSRLNSVYPQSTDLGHLMAAPQMSNLILSVLGKLMPKQSVAGHASSAFIDIQFSQEKHNKLRFFERLAGGVGASAARHGEDGWEIWGRQSLKPSFEEIEKRFPIRIIRQEKRDGSGGRGIKTGGHGLRRSYSVLETGRLRWAFDQSKSPGYGGGSAGDETQIIHTPAGQEAVQLKSRGEIILNPGDVLTILSAGGGGHGRSTEA